MSLIRILENVWKIQGNCYLRLDPRRLLHKSQTIDRTKLHVVTGEELVRHYCMIEWAKSAWKRNEQLI